MIFPVATVTQAADPTENDSRNSRTNLVSLFSLVDYMPLKINTWREGAANMQRNETLQMDSKQCVLAAFLFVLSFVPFHFLLSDS